MKIAIKDLRPNPIWHGERDSINALADNIKALGGQPIQKPVVRSKNGKYQVICGWRRVLACKKAKIVEIDCEIRDMPDERVGALMLSENLFRSNIDDATKGEICKKIYKLEKKKEASSKAQIQKLLSPTLGITERAIGTWLKTLELPPEIIEQVKKKKIKGQTARKANKVGGKKMVETAIEQDITTTQMDKMAAELKDIEENIPDVYEEVKAKVISGEITDAKKVKEKAEALHVKKNFESLAKQFGAPDIHELTRDDILKSIKRLGAFFQVLLDNEDIKTELLTDNQLFLDLKRAMRAACELAEKAFKN